MNEFELKPVNPSEWKSRGAGSYEGLRPNVNSGYFSIGRKTRDKESLEEGSHILLSNHGKRWFVTFADEGGFVIKSSNKGSLNAPIGKALASQIVSDLRVKPKGIISLSQDRLPSGGHFWYELKYE